MRASRRSAGGVCNSAWIAALAAIIALAFATAHAGEPGNVRMMSLDDCVGQGLSTAVSVANAVRGREIAAARIRQTRAQVLPSLTARGAYTRLDETASFDLGGSVLEIGSLDNYSSSLSLSQLLYSGGKAGAAIRASRLYRQYADISLDRARQVLVRDVTTGFHDLLLARKTVDLAEESVALLREFVGRADEKLANGAVSDFDALSFRVRLAGEIPKLVRARGRLATAREAFANLIGMDAGTFDVIGDWVVVELTDSQEALRDEALRSNAELKLMDMRTALLAQDLQVAKGAYYPEARASATFTGQQPDPMSFTGVSWGWHWNVGATIEWPLFDGGLRGGVVAEKKLELERAAADLADLKKAILLAVKQAYLDFKHAEEAGKGTGESILLAEKALGIATIRLQQGLATHLEVTESALALSSAKLEHFSTQRDRWDALSRLRFLCGRSPDGGEREKE